MFPLHPDCRREYLPLVFPGTFKYDPFGRRIQKASAAGGSNYVYDGANITEQVDAAGLVQARYAQGLGIDEPVAMQRDGNLDFFAADVLGSVTSLTDASGTIGASYTYESFGGLLSTTGTLANVVRYTGREYDSETGIYYYRARYYDATMGRFISEDPIWFEGGINFYAYVRNNSPNLEDPSGLLAEVICEPVQQYHLGFLIGARHCRLRVSCGQSIPDRTYELNGRSATQPLTVANYDPSRPGYRVPLKAPAGDCCKFEHCLVKQFDFYWNNTSTLPPYDPINSNSNAFIKNLVTSCGGQVSFPMLQYHNPLSWYNFYGQMPD